MQNFRKIKPRFWVILLSVLAVVFTAAYSSQQRYINSQRERIAALNEQKTALAEENAVLQRKIDFTYTDEYIEREARSRLGLIKEGEILYETTD
ncbi:MAG: septum formation initiator family protein [Clostridia bacterium]|nr:septum formation initiator family protein [Clostridia bacterium]